ncbi:hypothetical protein [Bacillus phage vB_BtM_BMBsp2]|nr:hypothetical protein [Bacillus phage vB_BtM_BMBsp2]
MTKRCPKCDQVKEFTEYYKNKSRKDGLNVYCKLCVKEDQKDYHVRNKEARLDYQRTYRENNREKVREAERKYRDNNREIHRAKDKRYRVKHQDKIREKNKKYREENKEYFLNKARERKLTIANVSDGTVTLEFEQELYKLQEGLCGYCGCNLEEYGKHLDHKLPLSRGGLHTSSNVHWTCPDCNLSKNNKTEEEWYKLLDEEN